MGDSPEEKTNYDAIGSPIVTYYDLQGSYPGEGNINLNPQSVDAEDGNFHLNFDSPCIDSGNKLVSSLPELDFEGDDRILGGDRDGTAVVDMGR